MDFLTEALKWIGDLPAEIWTILPGLGLPGWIAWLPKVATGLLGLTAVTRVIPDKWMYVPITQALDKAGLAVGIPIKAFGKAVSAAGRKALGKAKWEKIEEHLIERALLVIFRAIFDGIALFAQRVRNAALEGLDMDDPNGG